MSILKKVTTIVVCCSIMLSGCITTTGGKSTGTNVGPQLSSFFSKAARLGKEPGDPLDPNKPKLDVIIPIFDPGLIEGKEYNKEGVWAELRRAESIRFAYKLKVALENTNVFGAIRVTPDPTATGDLYIIGKIDESDSEDVEINVSVYDIAGNHWLTESIDHEVDESFHKNIRNEGKDPYDPLFEEAAKEIVEELAYKTVEELTKIKQVAELRFGANFIEEAFMEHMEINGSIVNIASFPSDKDPMLLRTRAIRVRDQLYVDGLQDNYRAFSERMNDSYLVWQKQSFMEIKAKSDAQVKAVGEGVVGVALIGLAILAVVAGASSDSIVDSTAATTAGTVGAIAGAGFLSDSFQTSKEAAVHRDALEELAQSINSDLSPQVVEFEEKSTELTGTAVEQFSQWRKFLKKIYLEEQTPTKQL